MKLKGMVYKTVVLYGAERKTWATTTARRDEDAEMDVRNDKKIQNERILIRVTTRVVQASKKIPEKRLKWYGHVMRMKEGHIMRSACANTLKK